MYPRIGGRTAWMCATCGAELRAIHSRCRCGGGACPEASLADIAIETGAGRLAALLGGARALVGRLVVDRPVSRLSDEGRPDRRPSG